MKLTKTASFTSTQNNIYHIAEVNPTAFLFIQQVTSYSLRTLNTELKCLNTIMFYEWDIITRVCSTKCKRQKKTAPKLLL